MYKSVFLFAPLLLIVLFGCSKEEQSEIVGSGKIIVEKRDVSGFDRIFFSGNGNLYIKQENQEHVKIEAEDNIASLLLTEVTDGTLHIYFKDSETASNIRSTQPINIYANVKKLKEINLSGSGTISSQHLDIQTLKVSISGSGNTDLKVFGHTIICVLSGSGRFSLKGAVDNQDIWISGSGIYESQDLVSKISNINVSGTGKVIVNVQDNVNVRISGSGVIFYKGNPKIIQTISGSGKIQQMAENVKVIE